MHIDRIFLIYTNLDAECQYPAKLFETNIEDERLRIAFRIRELGENAVLIDRKVKNVYDSTDLNDYTNYWSQLRDTTGRVIGLMGLQVKMEAYDKLIPPAVTEEPFGISLMTLYDSNINLIWQWDNCKDDNECG